MGEVDVNLRKDDVEDTGVGGPCFLIRLARWSLARGSVFGRCGGGDTEERWSASHSNDPVVSTVFRQIVSVSQGKDEPCKRVSDRHRLQSTDQRIFSTQAELLNAPHDGKTAHVILGAMTWDQTCLQTMGS